MPNKDPGNLHWRNKLENADELSAKTLLDKDAAWGKLHNRLRENPNRKKIVWYWIAAACLSLALFAPLMLVRKNENSLVKIDIRKSALPRPELKQKESLKDTIAAISAINIIKNKTVKNKISNYNNKTINNTIVESSETDDNQTAADKVILSVPVTDSAVAVIVPPKKKLKVVHINELGDPVEASPVVEHHTDLHIFQLKLATQEVYNKSSVASNTTGLPVLKLKTSN